VGAPVTVGRGVANGVTTTGTVGGGEVAAGVDVGLNVARGVTPGVAGCVYAVVTVTPVNFVAVGVGATVCGPAVDKDGVGVGWRPETGVGRDVWKDGMGVAGRVAFGEGVYVTAAEVMWVIKGVGVVSSGAWAAAGAPDMAKFWSNPPCSPRERMSSGFNSRACRL